MTSTLFVVQLYCTIGVFQPHLFVSLRPDDTLKGLWFHCRVYIIQILVFVNCKHCCQSFTTGRPGQGRLTSHPQLPLQGCHPIPLGFFLFAHFAFFPFLCSLCRWPLSCHVLKKVQVVQKWFWSTKPRRGVRINQGGFLRLFNLISLSIKDLLWLLKW